MMHLYWHVFQNLKYRKGKMMSFVVGNHDIVGTCLQGTINTSYNRLVEVFGKPTVYEGNETDGKVQAEWAIKFADGTLATIYDWKEEGNPYEGVTEWHVGGHTQHALYNVIDEIV